VHNRNRNNGRFGPRRPPEYRCLSSGQVRHGVFREPRGKKSHIWICHTIRSCSRNELVSSHHHARLIDPVRIPAVGEGNDAYLDDSDSRVPGCVEQQKQQVRRVLLHRLRSRLAVYEVQRGKECFMGSAS
jgi:hypothetical protein